MGHLSQFRHVVSPGGQFGHDPLIIISLQNLRGTRHDPDIVTFVAANDGLAVVIAEMGNN